MQQQREVEQREGDDQQQKAGDSEAVLNTCRETQALIVAEVVHEQRHETPDAGEAERDRRENGARVGEHPRPAP